MRSLLISILLNPAAGLSMLKGTGNTVTISRQHHAGNVSISVENGASLSMGAGCVIGNLCVYALVKGVFIKVGERNGFNGLVWLVAHEASNLILGDDCLFASDCSLSTSDVHKISDVSTGERLNKAGDIVRGNRVWLARNVTVLRSSTISDDTVVGIGSVVKANFLQMCYLPGSLPALKRQGSDGSRSGLLWDILYR